MGLASFRRGTPVEIRRRRLLGLEELLHVAGDKNLVVVDEEEAHLCMMAPGNLAVARPVALNIISLVTVKYAVPIQLFHYLVIPLHFGFDMPDSPDLIPASGISDHQHSRHTPGFCWSWR